MGVSQEHAVKIAQEFVSRRLPSCGVRLDSPAARREGSRWAIIFERISSPDVVVSPAEVIVLVDESGAAELEHAL